MLILLDMIWHDHISCWVSILSESALWVRGSWFLLRPFFLGVQFSNFKTHGIHRLHPMHSQLVELSLAPRTEQTTWLVSLSGHGSWRALNSLKKTRVCAYHPVIKHDLLENPPCIDKFRSWKAPVFSSYWLPEAPNVEDFIQHQNPAATPQAPNPHAQWIRAEPLIIGLGKSGARGIAGFFWGKKCPEKAIFIQRKPMGTPCHFW